MFQGHLAASVWEPQKEHIILKKTEYILNLHPTGSHQTHNQEPSRAWLGTSRVNVEFGGTIGNMEKPPREPGW